MEVLRNQYHSRNDDVLTAQQVWERAKKAMQRKIDSLTLKASEPIDIPKFLPQRRKALPATFEDLVRAAYPVCYPVPRKHVSISEITQAVSKITGVCIDEIMSARRTKNEVIARQMIMAIAKKFTPMSLPAIGRYVGDRDHTTVLYACNKWQPIMDAAAKRVDENASYIEWIRTIFQMVNLIEVANYQKRNLQHVG